MKKKSNLSLLENGGDGVEGETPTSLRLINCT